MPYGDGTGPDGRGPRGRRMGPCGWNNKMQYTSEYAQYPLQSRGIYGRFFGQGGYGQGYGRGRQFGKAHGRGGKGRRW